MPTPMKTPAQPPPAPVTQKMTSNTSIEQQQPKKSKQKSSFQTFIRWMNKPPAGPSYILGLEYLTTIDTIFVKQQMQILEVVTGIECANKYVIVNSLGEQMYHANEESSSFLRQFCTDARGFIIHITDNTSKEVIRITRDFKCSIGCCWCASIKPCALEVVVEAPVGHVIGKIKQIASFLQPNFVITSPEDIIIFRVKGPTCVFDGSCYKKDQKFNVYSPDESEHIAMICKQFTGLATEMFSCADNFSVSFPMNLDVKLKAVLVGAVFLIDLMYF